MRNVVVAIELADQEELYFLKQDYSYENCYTSLFADCHKSANHEILWN